MCIVQTYSHQSATIKAKPVGNNGVVQVDYFGIFTDAAAAELVPTARNEGDRGRVALVRVDRAILACDVLEHSRKTFTGSPMPTAVVVRDDQRREMLVTCSALSASGMPVVVFLDYAQALGWADRLAMAISNSELLEKRQQTHLYAQTDRMLQGCRQITRPEVAQDQKIRVHR